MTALLEYFNATLLVTTYSTMNKKCSAGRRKKFQYVINNWIPAENFLGILLLLVYCYSQAVTTATAIIMHLVNLHGEIETVFAGNITIMSLAYVS